MIFITPGGMLYSQISIYVSFKPWIIPIWWPEQEYRFETRVRSDGKVDWLQNSEQLVFHIPHSCAR